MTVESAVEKTPKAKCDETVERSPVAVATDLSINQPKKEEVCTATSLPAMTIMNPENPTQPALTDTAIQTANKGITDALNPGMFSSVRFDQIKNSIIAMNGSDMQRLERSFDKPGESGTLRKMLQEKLTPAQFREAEALLDRKSGKPNLIGNIATAIEVSNQGGVEPTERAGRMLRATVGVLTPEQVSALKKEWDGSKYAKQYGTFDEAIKKAGFNESDKQLMQGLYSRDKRTPADIAEAAKLVVNTYNKNEWDNSKADQYLRQLSDVLGGTSPEAVAARKALQGDKEFMAAYDKAFGPSTWANETQKRVAQDLLTEGRISLSTIVSGNTKTIAGLFDNNDVISTALTNATPKERADFVAGEKLASQNPDRSKLTAEQRDQLDYYTKLDETFRSRGGERQAAAWKEELREGKKGLISEAAATHSDGGLLGIGAGHSPDALARVFENMTPQQWEQIRRKDNKESPYLTELKASLTKYVSGPELERLNKMLDDKSRARSFDDSQKVRRGLDQVASDVGSTPEGRKSLAERVLTMTPAEAQQYKNDEALRKKVGDVLNQPEGIDEKSLAATVLAQSVLKQVEQTGKPVTQLTPLQQFAKDTMDGKLDTPTKKIDAAEKLMLGDPALRARLSDYQSMLDKGTLSKDFKFDQENQNLTAMLKGATSEFGFRNLLRGEQVGIGEKIAAGGGVLGDGFKGRYPDIAKIQPQSERDRIVGMLSPEQQKIVQNVIKQGGTTDLADEAKSYLIGDGGGYREFVQKIAKMNDTDRANFFKSFESKYGQDFKSAFVEGAVKREGLSSDYKTVLDKLATQNFKPTLADEMRLKVLDGQSNPYQQFEDRLKGMTPAQIQQLKSEYAGKYNCDLDKDFLGQIDNAGAKITFERMLKGTPTDPVSEFLERTATMDLTGANLGGSQLGMERALQLNRDFIAQYQANREKLPQDVRDRIDKYFTQATQQNLDEKQRLADLQEKAINAAAVAAAVASIYASFGTATPLAAGVIATGFTTSAARPFLMQEVLGNQTITSEEFRRHAIQGGIDAALLAPLGTLGRSYELFNTIRNGDRATETVNALLQAEKGLPTALRVEPTIANAQKLEDVLAAGRRVEQPINSVVEAEKIVPKLTPVVTEVETAARIGDDVVVAKPVLTAEVRTAEQIAADAKVVPPAKVATEAKLVEPAAEVQTGTQVVAEVAPTLVRASNEATVVAEREALALAASKGDQAALAALKTEDRALLVKLAEANDPAAVKALNDFDRKVLAQAVERGEKSAADLAAFDRKVLEQAAATGDKQAIARLIELDRAPLAKAAETGDEAAVTALRNFDRKVLEQAAARGDAKAIETLAAIRKSEAAARIVSSGLIGADAALKLGVPALAVERMVDAAGDPPKPVEKPLVPSAKLLELATVKRGEGPWQSAERILAADGKKHSVDEVRALTKAIQAAYKMDNNGNGDMSGLKVKYSFAGMTDKTFANIVANCKDDKVKALLLSMAKS